MSRHTARARSGQDRTSLYAEITDKIIAELEEGRAPWVQLLGDAGGEGPARHAGGACGVCTDRGVSL